MKREHIFLIFIFIVTFLSVYLLYLILVPFLSSILWAILLAIVFYPLFQKFQRRFKKRKVLPALLMTLLVLIAIVLPFTLLMVSLAGDAIGLYHQVEEMIKTGQLQAYFERIKEIPVFRWILAELGQHIDLSQTNPLPLLLNNINRISTFIFNQTTVLLKGLSTLIVGFFFTLLSLYYLLKDGSHLFGRLEEIIPLPSRERDLFIQRFKDMIHATIYGGILIAMIQGVLGGLSFWILGLPSPVFWGSAMALFSFIPIGGTALIWGPTAVILLIGGAVLKGLILLGLGILVISMAENILRPLFISTRTNIHPLLLFFAVLGGIQAFGLIGLVAGPLIATLFLTLVEIYIQGIRPEKNSSEG